MLGGAVVGGGSGVTSIFYNPAGISEVRQSNVTLNSSMFSVVYKTYENALGENQELSQFTFEIMPRFVSYLYRSKKFIELSWEISLFNRESREVFMDGTYESDAAKYGFENGERYFGSYDYWEKYNDYYAGIGTSYEINDNWIVGLSSFVSVKDLRSYNNISSAIFETDNFGWYDPTQRDLQAGWNSYKLVNFLDVRVLTKLGLKYRLNKEISLGVTVSFPSFRVFSYASSKKIIESKGIKDEHGNPLPDKYHHESAQYVKAQFKDPFSIAVGVRRKPLASKNIYSITIEWFAKINPYKAIDAERGKSIFGDQVYGTEFSNYYMGNRSVINFAFGYKREVRENFELLFGFKSDFFSYYLPDSFKKAHQNANTFIKIGSDMLHFSSGANFIFKKKFKINMGGSISYGRKTNNTQLVNFVDAQWYDPETGLALQGERKDDLTYRHIILGLYLGFSLDF